MLQERKNYLGILNFSESFHYLLADKVYDFDNDKNGDNFVPPPGKKNKYDIDVGILSIVVSETNKI